MIKRHLSSEIKERVVKTYFSGEATVLELSRALKVERPTIYRWIKRYQAKGKLDRIQNPLSGRQSKINKETGKKLLRILKNPASKYGYETDFWTTARVQQILQKQLKLKVSRMAIYRSLKKLNCSYRKPESRYYGKNKEKELEVWKTDTVPRIKRTVAKHRAILYFEDESNISLSPVVAKTWAPVGKKLLREISPNRGSVAAISAINGAGSLIFNIHDGNKRFNSEDILLFLLEMLKHHPRRHLVVIMDRAPCHRSKKVREFVESQKRLHVFYLPARAPELNPDEQVWGHLKNEELKEHKAKTTKELKKVAKKKLKKNVRK